MRSKTTARGTCLTPVLASMAHAPRGRGGVCGGVLAYRAAVAEQKAQACVSARPSRACGGTGARELWGAMGHARRAANIRLRGPQ